MRPGSAGSSYLGSEGDKERGRILEILDLEQSVKQEKIGVMTP